VQSATDVRNCFLKLLSYNTLYLPFTFLFHKDTLIFPSLRIVLMEVLSELLLLMFSLECHIFALLNVVNLYSALVPLEKRNYRGKVKLVP